MEERHVASAAKILKSINYMTLATVCADGSPWNSPVAPTYDGELVFRWGSNEESVHSQNVRREKRVFVVIYDSTAPEGLGEGVYMKGEAEELDEYEDVLKMYRFRPQQIWINDEEKNEDGSFKKDIRIELNIEDLKKALGA
ncbi:MAG TPA: pyridoxamine 5'-phosphate oxidase family protein [Candidatus Paceibacterota bacterium]|nr:pyridoxamine 5'-phosphate oxidase family protein [Candidatus Paceibacterota bacterium]